MQQRSCCGNEIYAHGGQMSFIFQVPSAASLHHMLPLVKIVYTFCRVINNLFYPKLIHQCGFRDKTLKRQMITSCKQQLYARTTV